MRRWIREAARLYPTAWRRRYGAEFDALLEDVQPDFRELSNVLRGAIAMRIRNGSANWKIVAALGAAGPSWPRESRSACRVSMPRQPC